MGNILLGNNIFYFEDEKSNNRITLLDCNKFLLNKSQIPMHSFDPDGITIPKFAMGLLKAHTLIFKGTRFEEYATDYFLIDLLLMSFMTGSAQPVNVVELGSDNGTLSYHIANTTGKLNSASSVYFVCNEINNDSPSPLITNISNVETPPECSMLVSDYHNTKLQSGGFDIVIINGSINFDEPLKVIDEAIRIIKKGGMIILHSDNNSPLTNFFSLRFDKYDKYDVDHGRKVYTVTYSENEWHGQQKPDLLNTAGKLISDITQSISPAADIKKLRSLTVKLDKCIDLAIEKGNTDIKLKLIDIKEHMLDYIININKEFEEYFRCEVIKTLEVF